MNLFRKTARRITPSDPAASVAEYAVSPDGRHVAYKEERGARRRFYVHRLATGQRSRVPVPSFDYSEPTWSDDGALLAFTAGRHFVGIYSLAEQDLVVSARFDMPVADLAFEPEGGGLWVLERSVDENTRLNMLDAATGEHRVINTDARQLISIHPAGPDQLLARVFEEDRYMMQSFDPIRLVWREAGPQSGVSYSPVVDAHSNTAYYLHAGADTPVDLLAVDLQTLEWQTIYRFSSPAKHEIAPFSRRALPGADGVSYYLYEPDGPASPPVVIWLHGSSSSFSPRWHKYAQYFANAGFAFAALNFSGSTGVPRPDLGREELRRLQADEVRKLVERIRSDQWYRDSPIIAVGVSYGTLLTDFTARRHGGIFDAVIDYSPLRAPAYIPEELPHLVFAGSNDAYADMDSIRAAFAKHRPHKSLRIFADEGHDLRHQNHIEERLGVSVEFINSATRRTRW